MDTFNEPSNFDDNISLEKIHEQVKALEDQHRARGVHLSGRVIHVCHSLPVVSTLNTRPGLSSPPATPPIQTKPIEPSARAQADATGHASSPTPPVDGSSTASLSTEDKEKPVWTLTPRHGHAAMISGIRSLSATHEQVIVGWTGDVQSPVPGERVLTSSIPEGEKKALEEALEGWQPREADPDDDQKTTYVPVWLDDKVAHGHYDGYCKSTLWPLFHYLLWQDISSESHSADEYYGMYHAANTAFADALAAVYRPGDLIWIHDYHLLLLSKMARERLPEAAMGLFLHTPFPSSEVFRCLPRRKEILDGMLGADLVCFQTYSYSRHFTSTCIRVCGYEGTSRGIDVEGHVAAVAHCPVGIDAQRVARDVLRPGIQPKFEALQTLYEGRKIIIGRDKLDVVKGVVQKLRAFEKLLQDYPEWIGKVVLIQVTSPALTDSPKLERQVSELVAHINGEYGGLDFIPVHHYHQTLKKDEFYALLSVADLAVITPLRDGMNTTSMEFVIAQERSKKSPSVLSEFMGISKNMSEALMVNPWNLDDLAAAMHKGLLMSPTEKVKRHDALYKVVNTHTSHSWAALLIRQLLGTIHGPNQARKTPYIPRETLEGKYEKARKRLFFFDYDGTLAPIVKVPSAALPSERTLLALEKLSADPKNLVYIISGRDGEFLETHLGHLKRVGFSAEHGGFAREPGATEWVNFTESLDMSWMSDVEEVFKYYTERTTGSHIELKKSSITWHYRGADPEWGAFQCRQCQDLLENNMAHKKPIEVLVGKKNLEVRPIAVNKGEIVKRLVYKNPDAEFIFCAGDDKTDEDMFRALNIFPSGAPSKYTMEPPLSVTLVDGGAEPLKPVELAIEPSAIFATAVGHSSKKTLALWHVTTPQEVVDHMLQMVDGVEAGKSQL
ncbi:glycosyltransferase family 20 protein [Pterulicium gracile]|uniref:Glycosyltransferase family 20 protein n=1 Tax=Pterulicium gracile TaxID=1884261 RepID=A0A5C3Q6P5_9AGAR|nr:glycosyltransferase family 20 protein [Pterula gracilis]